MRWTRMVALFASTVAALFLTGLLTGCTSATPASSITVFAAASLKSTFTEIGKHFTTDNPGVGVDFNFGGSSDLATQLAQGATADVFASADISQMDNVARAGLLADEPRDFASNTLVIVTAPGNPKNVDSFADLAKRGLTVVVCQQPVPCGSATKRLEDSTNVQLDPVSEEPNVTDVLNKVTSGQADAGVVYVTDASSAGDKVAAVTFPQAASAVNVYPIAVLKEAPRSGLAQSFVDMVTGETGQQILHQAGFAKP